MRVVACLIAATLATGTLPQNTVRDMVRRTGDVELVRRFEYEPAYIKELVQKSTLVARVSIRAERVHLTDDQESVVTDYDVELIQVVRNKIRPEKSIITVRKPGRILSLDGHTVTAIEQDFPPFLVGVEYLLCLARSKDGFFETVYGPKALSSLRATRQYKCRAIELSGSGMRLTVGRFPPRACCVESGRSLMVRIGRLAQSPFPSPTERARAESTSRSSCRIG